MGRAAAAEHSGIGRPGRAAVDRSAAVFAALTRSDARWLAISG
jgi:hypothetical protein